MAAATSATPLASSAGTARDVVPTDSRRRRGRETRRRIMTSAAELFAAQGFDATSTQAIATASGITVAAIYRHFPSKAELLVAVADDAFETTFADTIHGDLTAASVADVVLAYVTPAREFTRRLVVELTHAASRHPDVAAAVAHFHARARDHIAAVLAAGQHVGDVPTDLDVDAAARDVLVLLMGVCHIDTLDPAAASDPRWPASLRRTVDATIGRRDTPHDDRFRRDTRHTDTV